METVKKVKDFASKFHPLSESKSGITTLKRLIKFLETTFIKDKKPNWLVAFAIGIILPFILFAVGHLFRSTYDTIALPILYKFMLPWLPLIFVAAVMFSIFRAEKEDWYRFIIMIFLGISVGLPVVYDWWYFVPIPFAIFIPFMVWRLRWHLWSRCQFSVVIVLFLVLMILGGSVINFQGMLPNWDNRFSLGLSLWLNYVFLFLLFAAIGFMLFYWAYRYWLVGDKMNRALLTDIIEREPRCDKYFDAVGMLTPCQIDSIKLKKGNRLPVCAKYSEKATDPIFPKTIDLPPKIDTYWQWGCNVLNYTWLVLLFRKLRSTVTKVALPSKVVQELLEEAAKREYQVYLRQMFESDDKKNLLEKLKRMNENEAILWKTAEERFARYIHLKEALIEAKYYFFLSVSCITPPKPQNYVPKLIDRLQVTRTNYPQNNTNDSNVDNNSPISDWQDASKEYLDLWQENIDRLVIKYGDMCLKHSIKNTDTIDFAQLTCNLLVCREQSFSSNTTIHQCAADLALWLFIASKDDDNKIINTLKSYFNEQRILLDRHPTRMTSEDWFELGLAGAAYALWMGSQGNWSDAGFAFTLFPTITDTDQQNKITLRNLAHVKAASTLQELKRGMTDFGIENRVNDALTAYRELDNLKQTHDGGCTGEILATCFINHVISTIQNQCDSEEEEE